MPSRIKKVAALAGMGVALVWVPARATAGTIVGRIVDPRGDLPREATLVLSRHDQPAPSGKPVHVGDDRSFSVSGLEPGVYVLELKNQALAPPQGANVLGFEVVDVGQGTSNVSLTVRTNHTLRGRLRFDGASPEWPPAPQVVVNAFLALDGVPLSRANVALAQPDGAFVLHNTFGPRVIRCGYTLAEGANWHPARVLFRGMDVTDIPIDFSAHPDGEVVVVFTRTSARISGVVIDDLGKRVPRAWLLITGDAASLWQPWSTKTKVVRADLQGEFTIVVPFGDYRVTAMRSETFSDQQDAQERMGESPILGTRVGVAVGERARISVTVQRR